MPIRGVVRGELSSSLCLFAPVESLAKQLARERGDTHPCTTCVAFEPKICVVIDASY